MTIEAYSPPRDIGSKLRRRLTQAKAARPARIKLERAVLSVCFDDFPHSAAALGAPLLERYGGRGTFYAAASLVDQETPCGRNFSRADIVRLSAVGHEIGCHTYSHADCARREVYVSLLDLARNRDALAEMGVRGELRSLAYPFGETSPEFKAALPPRYLCARGTAPGLNIGRVDLAHLHAIPLYGDELGQAEAALRMAAKRKAWMIAYTHDVSDTPSAWGVTPRALDQFLAHARQAGIMIAPVSHALGWAAL